MSRIADSTDFSRHGANRNSELKITQNPGSICTKTCRTTPIVDYALPHEWSHALARLPRSPDKLPWDKSSVRIWLHTGTEVLSCGGRKTHTLSVWFLLTTRARRWAPPRAAVTRWWPSTDPESSPSLQGATTARYPPGVRPEGRGRRE